MKKKDISSILALIKQQLKDTESDLSYKLYQNQLNLSEKASKKGLSHSGLKIKDYLTNLDEEIDVKLNVTFNYITKLQQEMNIKYNKDVLKSIEEECKNFYKNVYQIAYNNIEECAINLSGENTGKNIANSNLRDNKINDIFNKIDKELKEITLKNKIRKDEPSLKISKKALLNSRIALVVSILAVSVSIYRWFFY